MSPPTDQQRDGAMNRTKKGIEAHVAADTMPWHPNKTNTRRVLHLYLLYWEFCCGVLTPPKPYERLKWYCSSQEAEGVGLGESVGRWRRPIARAKQDLSYNSMRNTWAGCRKICAGKANSMMLLFRRILVCATVERKSSATTKKSWDD